MKDIPSPQQSAPGAATDSGVTTSQQRSSEGGVVQVAVFREAATWQEPVFYDFNTPLQILREPGWNQALRAGSDGSFFVFSIDA